MWPVRQAHTGTCLSCPKHTHARIHAIDSPTCLWPFVSANAIKRILSQDMEREQDDRREVHEQAVICLSSLSQSLTWVYVPQGIMLNVLFYPLSCTAGVMGIVNLPIFEL